MRIDKNMTLTKDDQKFACIRDGKPFGRDNPIAHIARHKRNKNVHQPRQRRINAILLNAHVQYVIHVQR